MHDADGVSAQGDADVDNLELFFIEGEICVVFLRVCVPVCVCADKIKTIILSQVTMMELNFSEK